MKDCCNSQGKSAWFHPNLVRIVVGVIMMSAGASKFLGGSATMGWVGGAVLSAFGVDASVGALATLAVVLGYIAATIELLGWLSFGLGCRKTWKYAAWGLTFVMAAAVLVHVRTLKPIDATGFKWFTGLLWQIQLPVLLFALFAQKAVSSCCQKVCSGEMKKCCSSEK